MFFFLWKFVLHVILPTLQGFIYSGFFYYGDMVFLFVLFRIELHAGRSIEL